jgi:hypothetical protein
MVPRQPHNTPPPFHTVYVQNCTYCIQYVYSIYSTVYGGGGSGEPERKAKLGNRGEYRSKELSRKIPT